MVSFTENIGKQSSGILHAAVLLSWHVLLWTYLSLILKYSFTEGFIQSLHLLFDNPLLNRFGLDKSRLKSIPKLFMRSPPTPSTFTLQLHLITHKWSREKSSALTCVTVEIGVNSTAKNSSLISQLVAQKRTSLIVCDIHCQNGWLVSPAMMSNKQNAECLGADYEYFYVGLGASCWPCRAHHGQEHRFSPASQTSFSSWCFMFGSCLILCHNIIAFITTLKILAIC